MKKILLILILLTTSAVAKEKKKKKLTKYIDETHRFISSHWVDLNYDFDVFFSDKTYDRKKNQSKIIASYELYKYQGIELKKAFDFKIKVHLPNVSKKLSVVLEKERDRILQSRSNTATQTQATEQNEYNAGVSYLIHKSKFWKTSFDTGIRLTLPLNPFAKFKAYHETELPIFNIYIGQEVMLYRHEGLGELTQVLFSKKFSESFRVSQNNVLSWSENTDDLVLRNALNFNHQIDHKRTLSYNTGANAYINPQCYYYRYDASITYHRLLYRKWLYGNFSVGAEFNKTDDFKMKHFGLIRLDVIFL